MGGSLIACEPLFNDDWSLFSNDIDCVIIYCGTRLCVQNDQTRQAFDLEVLRCCLHSWVLKRERQPGHISKVSIVLVFLLIAREENNFKEFLVLIVFIIQLN